MSLFIENIKDHFTWRHQIFKLAKSDIIRNYTGSALGWAWALVKPTVIILVFWFVFTVGLRAGDVAENVPFIIWFVPGIVPWFYMEEMITDGSSVFLRYSYLITKMKFPVPTIPTFVAVAKLVVHLFLLVITTVIFVITGWYPDIYYLQIPLYMALMIIFFTNWALFSATLSTLSRDWMNLVMAVTTAVFWMSGIIFDINTIGNNTVRHILMANPINFIAEGYRDSFVYKRWFWEKPTQCLVFLGALLIMTLVANATYKKLYKDIPDVL
ncbi:MAG: ABC transporter permease [Clostridiales Family XIII bacterium]|nr:ABC transporter permease [Clostridiales Family XIII bacterium]